MFHSSSPTLNTLQRIHYALRGSHLCTVSERVSSSDVVSFIAIHV